MMNIKEKEFIIAINVEFVELEVKKILFIVIHVVFVFQNYNKKDINVN
jgi:hypothetical protein